MKPRFRFLCVPALFLIVVADCSASSADSLRSLALKGPAPRETAFGFKVDNSAARYWDEFNLVRNANAGDPLAQHELGIRYLTRDGFPSDTAKAAFWIKKAADQNLTPARYNYGLMLNNGWGISWNPFGAYEQFLLAAMKGMVEAEYVVGLLLTDNLTVPRDYAGAYRWESLAADSGYEAAREILKEFKRRRLDRRATRPECDSTNRKGRKARTHLSSVPQTASGLQPIFLDTETDSIPLPDDTTLTREVLLAANAQLTRMQVPNPARSEKSDGEADSAMVRRIFDAGEAGSPEALTLIGRWYERGAIMKEDAVEAAVYYLRAMRFDSPWASALLWKMIRREDFFRRLKEEADRNEPSAQFAWAELIASDFDHQLTQTQALGLLQSAAAHGYPPAVVELGMSYYTGTWLKQNRERAIGLLQKADGMGFREAGIRLAMIDVQEQKKSAPAGSSMTALRRAMEDGSVLAQTMLAYCYETGLGVSRDTSEAVRLYRKASQRGSNAAYSALKNMYDGIRPPDPRFRIAE
ncbi:MAG: sel1 repeat family protein [Ignavibacteria bacterium]|nr:MAG: sel1 repeat family protein [Ignavibacteria bacterium]